MLSLLKTFAANESGATAIEYGLIVALIGAAVTAAMTGLGNSVKDSYTNIGTALSGQTPASW